MCGGNKCGSGNDRKMRKDDDYDYECDENGRIALHGGK